MSENHPSAEVMAQRPTFQDLAKRHLLVERPLPYSVTSLGRTIPGNQHSNQQRHHLKAAQQRRQSPQSERILARLGPRSGAGKQSVAQRRRSYTLREALWNDQEDEAQHHNGP
jgi:hypothetical protein